MGMFRQPQIIALDLDDTLLRSDGAVSPRTSAALEKWAAAGHRLVVATGRPPRSIPAALPPQLRQVPWIAYNGAEVYVDGQRVYANLISVEATRAIIDLVMATMPDCALGLEIDDTLYLNRPIQRTSPYEIADLWSVATRPAAKILFFHQDFDELQPLLDGLPDEARAMLSVKYDLVQILAASADKADGLRYLAASWGLDMSRVIAFGDDINDVDMVRESGYGIAVANAVDEVKAVADRVTLSNDHDGVAVILEELACDGTPSDA